jgi:hypothetical protein
MDWLKFLNENEPALTVLGAVLAAFWGFIVWIWSRHKKFMKYQNTALVKLGEGIANDRKESLSEHAKIKETLMSYRAELHLFKKEMEPLKPAILNLEGAIRNQQHTINDYVEKMGKVSGKLDAVFAVFEAQARATDVLKRGK